MWLLLSCSWQSELRLDFEMTFKIGEVVRIQLWDSMHEKYIFDLCTILAYHEASDTYLVEYPGGGGFVQANKLSHFKGVQYEKI